jgi:hypothetical protein
MAASRQALERIFKALFTNPNEIVALRDALLRFHKDDPAGTRGPVDTVLTRLHNGTNPNADEIQIRQLKKFMTWREFAAIAPVGLGENAARTELMEFYANLFGPKFPQDLRDLHELVFDYHTYNASENKIAVIDKVRRLGPNVRWGNSHLNALRRGLVRDARFSQLDPYGVTGNTW